MWTDLDEIVDDNDLERQHSGVVYAFNYAPGPRTTVLDMLTRLVNIERRKYREQLEKSQPKPPPKQETKQDGWRSADGSRQAVLRKDGTFVLTWRRDRPDGSTVTKTCEYTVDDYFDRFDPYNA